MQWHVTRNEPHDKDREPVLKRVPPKFRRPNVPSLDQVQVSTQLVGQVVVRRVSSTFLQTYLPRVHSWHPFRVHHLGQQRLSPRVL